MHRCPSCASDIPEGKRFCGDCGAPVTSPASAPTETSVSGRSSDSRGTRPVSAPSFDSFDNARFLPGTILAGRYRIVGLIGSGGMGEVYRADDMRLGQPVALKFLPEEFEQDASRLSRFLGEVRIARQVTHPNVCRVYDVAEADGKHFLSMEYVDGEDLGSLLRRIGRLPQDKAVQLARQVCAGLAAAHDQGILHRDLKPANVMIDGRGRARLTDFGLAGLAEAFDGAEVRAGTPAYMAPEQLSGDGVSMKSDLYSLGLVLYELFTGKRAFDAPTAAELMRLQQESTPTMPTTHVSDLDPAVERVILRCLDKDPIQRPASALAVAAALPGGDPLAAALAAGETPSPEMVAAAGPEGGLGPRVAMICLVVILAGVAVLAALAGRNALYSELSDQKPMAALMENAREIAAKLGYDEPPEDSVGYYSFRTTLYRHLVKESKSVREYLAQPGQMLIRFFYRQRPTSLAPQGFDGQVGKSDPPGIPGDVSLHLDLQGRLTWFEARPPLEDYSAETTAPVDWTILFEVSDLVEADFEPTTPTLLPEVYADTRMAWAGTLTEAGEMPVRLEAAAYRGKPVYFERILPYDGRYLTPGSTWSRSEKSDRDPPDSANRVLGIVILTILVVIAGAAVFLALRNARLGRGDRKGAMRIAIFVFAARMLSWLIGGHHVAGVADLFLFIVAGAGALLLAATTWVLYMALEPYVRRLWPQAIVGWSRFLAGRFRDPLVGRDVLLGMTLGVGLQIFGVAAISLGEAQGWIPTPQSSGFLGALRGGRYLVSELFTLHLVSLSVPLAFLLLFLLFRLVFRFQWLAATVICVLNAMLTGFGLSAQAPDPSFGGIVFGVTLGLVNAAVLIVLLTRFGLLATFAAVLVGTIFENYLFTLDFSKPYAAAGLFGMLVIAAYAVYAFRTSLAGRPLFEDKLLKEN
jgi:serine/threonine-protein kinase